jgi:large subunit ribosomal protein L22
MAELETTLQSENWIATHRYARISPRKTRLVIDMIRGMNCDAALDVLKFNHRRGAMLISSVLKSAMANANEKEADMNRLFVSEARVDAGPYYRRFQPKDRGRAHPIAKQTSHIIVRVAER